MVGMLFKIMARKENYEKYKKMLEQGGFIVSDDADLVLKELNSTIDNIVGKYRDRYEFIPYQEIVYIESFGHDVICYTLEKEYAIKEKLYEIEGLFEDKGFIRINKSCIVNKWQIKEIRPSFNMKLILIMKNNHKLEVTRSYYYQFKEFIGF